MAICSVCGNEYDETTVNGDYDVDEYISENGLEGTNPDGMCADCAVNLAMEVYPAGLEILAWPGNED